MIWNGWKVNCVAIRFLGDLTTFSVVTNKALDCIMEHRSLSIPQFSHILSPLILMNKINMR